MSSFKTNPKLNANTGKEQKRLATEYPDSDIVKCRATHPIKECYVKNRLQPTFAFADFALKYPEFNNPNDLPTNQ